jgi:hypothetical protein
MCLWLITPKHTNTIVSQHKHVVNFIVMLIQNLCHFIEKLFVNYSNNANGIMKTKAINKKRWANHDTKAIKRS